MNIAIIGAGLAGCTAAEELTNNGANITVFEKSRGLGGRLSTKRRNWAWLDMGAQYFTARSEAFIRQTSKWLESGVAKHWDAHFLTYDNRGLSISPDDTERYVGTPKMNAFLDRLRDSQISINVECKIQQISCSNNLYYCNTENEQFGPFDVVISTTPYNQAITILEPDITISGKNKAFLMDPTWAVGLQFAEPLMLHSTKNVGGIFVKKGNLTWIGHNSNKPTRNRLDTGDTWILHFDPAWSAQHIEEKGDWITGEGIKSLQNMVDMSLPEITNKIAHRWRYARNKDTPLPKTNGYLKAEDEAIYLAGDWALGGRVENAFLSGLYTAKAILI